MDFTTIVGLLGALGLLGYGISEGGSLRTFFNTHGFTIVLGGTFFATLVNSSFRNIRDSIRAGFALFLKPRHVPPDQVVTQVVRMALKCRQQGVFSLQDEGASIDDDGFLARAIEVALTTNDERVARVTLEKEIHQIRVRHREVGNTFRTAGLLSPMFGLLGTLIGIINVLRNITDPAQVGPSMGIAISSAFFGILLANLFFVPGAGKLRTRSIEELLSKEMLMVGVLDIVFTNKIPLLIEMHLQSYFQMGKSRGEEAKPPLPPHLATV